MHRIDSVGNVGGLWSDGNPVAGLTPTRSDDDWFNAVQEELIAPLTAAGITPVKGSNGQVLDAIRRLTHRPAARQCVQHGALSSGLPAILSTSVNLNVNILATATAIRLTFASGVDAYGNVDLPATVSADTTTLLTASQANCWIYATFGAPVTFGHSILAPVYGYTHPGSPATDQHSYLIPEGRMYRWSGAAWVAVQRVFIGRATTSGSAVTAVESFAFNGRNIVQSAALAANQIQNLSHALGMKPGACRVHLVNLTTEGNWAVGDELPYIPNYDDGAADNTWTVGFDNLNVTTHTDATALVIMNKTSAGTQLSITMANWAFRCHCDRGW